MFSLWSEPEDIFEFTTEDDRVINGQLDMHFANILHLFEVLESDETPYFKLTVGLGLLTGNSFYELSEQDQTNLFSQLMEQHVMDSKPMIDPDAANGKPAEELYNLTEDADYIFASFWQDYQINLRTIKFLHWQEFRALLSGLTESTKFKQVVAIRARKPEKGMSAKERQELKNAQLAYALHTTKEDVEFASLDFDDREQYLIDHPEYAKRLEPDEGEVS